MKHMEQNKTSLWALEENILATLKDHSYYQNHRLEVTTKNKFNNENGLGTIEIIIILAVLVSLALAFQAFTKTFFNGVKESIPDSDSFSFDLDEGTNNGTNGGTNNGTN